MTMKSIGRIAAALSLVVLPAFAYAEEDETAHVKALETTVAVEDVQSTRDEVVGRVVNETDDQLEDVRLIVADEFRWRNEFHPGPESPGDAHTFTLKGPIPPHGSTTFRFERPSPLPERRDGDFHTQVSAVGVVRRPLAQAVAPSVVIERRELRTYQQED